jgi:oligosaccharide 4-alpha-D-glucosyltransferase
MNMDQYTGKNLRVNYYYSADTSSFTMYDDDGKTNKSWAKNQFELITFSSSQKKSKQVIEVKSNDGKYFGIPNERNMTILLIGLPNKPSKISVNGNNFSHNVLWNESGKILQLNIQYKNDDEKVEIKY